MFVVIKEVESGEAIGELMRNGHWQQKPRNNIEHPLEFGKYLYAKTLPPEDSVKMQLGLPLMAEFWAPTFGEVQLLALDAETLLIVAREEEGFKLAIRDIGQEKLIPLIFQGPARV